MRHLLSLELQLELRPHSLDWVVLGGVGNIEDSLDAVLEQELRDLLAVMHPAVVHEKYERIRLVCLKEREHELYEAFAVDRPGADEVPLESSVR